MTRPFPVCAIVSTMTLSTIGPAFGADAEGPLRRYLYVTVPDGAGGTKGHRGITFSIDGQYAWPDTGDVIDAKTKKIVATLKDADGKRVVNSKFIEVQFKGNDAIRIGHQLGVGRVVPPARQAAGK